MKFNSLKTLGIITLINTVNFHPLLSVQANTVTAPSNQTFALIAENQVYINNGGDFDGEPESTQDDALIYAANGFTINNLSITTLPVKRNSDGSIVTDTNNKKVLVNNAVAVSSNNPAINAPNNPYSGLTPPPQVAAQTVTITSYDTLKTEEINKRGSGGTTVTFNPSSSPINSVSDWNNLFPQGGTATQPKVVNVTGGLNIPGGVNLSNYIITVDGTINFNGSSTLNNVVLIVNSGGINLGGTQFTNSAVFAPGVINMNNTARFSGKNVIASKGDVNFDGATVTTSGNDEVQVVSQGSITYNAALSSRGNLLSAVNVTFNGNTTLYGTIGAKNNIIFNGNGSIIATSNVVINNSAAFYAD